MLPSPLFWYGLDVHEEEASIGLGKGVRVLLSLRSVGEANEQGVRRVSFVVNGQTRAIDTRDRAVASDRPEAERVDPSRPGQVGAPFRGVVTPTVAVGDEVLAGDSVALIEAMKMESTISASIDGTIERIAAAAGASLEGGDLILGIRPTGVSASPEYPHG